ncbi:hypothetical protein PMAYCL1PPCAC_04323, partial [Pristionchus mayeri]
AELLRVLHHHHVVVARPLGWLATFSSDHQENDVLATGEISISMNWIVVHALVPSTLVQRVEVIELLRERVESLSGE